MAQSKDMAEAVDAILDYARMGNDRFDSDDRESVEAEIKKIIKITRTDTLRRVGVLMVNASNSGSAFEEFLELTN